MIPPAAIALWAALLVAGAASVLAARPDTAVVVFSRGEAGYYCHKIPYLLRTAANTLLAWAEGRGKSGREACDDFSGTDLVFKRSIDGGKSWSALSVFVSNSSATDVNVIGNAAPVQDRHTGRIWVPFCRNNEQVYITYSDDDGVTWSPPVHHPELVLPNWKWVGVGPPAGLQLTSGRLLIPGYHTVKVKGDGELSKGHTLYSDDHGVTWKIGSLSFGFPFLTNENQAVQLKNGHVLINARTTSNRRVQVTSRDGGITFGLPKTVSNLEEPLEGCEGSTVRLPDTGALFLSVPFTRTLTRLNMTIFNSNDEGASWKIFRTVDVGSVAYSALQPVPPECASCGHGLELLYERAEKPSVVFEPDEIVYYRVF